jgi:twitching motility protein PilT
MNLELMNSGEYNPASAFQPDQALYFIFHEFLSSRFKFLDFFASLRLGVKNFRSAGTLKLSWGEGPARRISVAFHAGSGKLASSGRRGELGAPQAPKRRQRRRDAMQTDEAAEGDDGPSTSKEDRMRPTMFAAERRSMPGGLGAPGTPALGPDLGGGGFDDVPAAEIESKSSNLPESDNIGMLLRQAVSEKASDIHLRANSPPRLRIDGDLYQVKGLVPTEEIMWRFFKRVLSPIQIQQFQRQLELDFSCSLEGVCRVRVNLYQERAKFCASIRIVPETIPSMEEIGLSEACMKFTNLSRGLVLVTGPTGSGKSTTLAAMINHVNASRRAHILTIEDPIEYFYADKRSLVSQRELEMDTRNFGSAMRHSFRQDPDVVLLGEMRDLETIQLAITLAETGHLTFSTLHTGTCTQTITRIIDAFPPHQQDQIRNQLSLSLEGVIAQRLLKVKAGHGRVAAREVMVCTRAIRNLIREGKYNQIYSSIQTGVEEGMITMETALGNLMRDGVIDYDAALKAAPNPRDFAEKYQGA